MKLVKKEVSRMLEELKKELQENVPGQLFRDIERFHQKFNLDPTKKKDHSLPEELQRFRIKFLIEELFEYCEAVGYQVMVEADTWGQPEVSVRVDSTKSVEPEAAFDALIDLVYVALGTAYLHRFPFNEGWDRVQAANMQKVRAKKKSDSKRNTTHDVVKPPGWIPPKLGDLL